MSGPIDFDALPGWRGQLRRPVKYRGERFEHATVIRHEWESGLWWLQLAPAQFVPIKGMAWWQERWPGRAVPQDGPFVAEDLPRVGDYGLPVQFLATEWRAEIGFHVDHPVMEREDLFVERFPRKEGPYDAVIEALANVERSRRHGHS